MFLVRCCFLLHITLRDDDYFPRNTVSRSRLSIEDGVGRKVIFLSSCLDARACLVGPCPSMEATHLTHQLKTMAQNLQVWSLEHVHRQRNSVAQKIVDNVTKDLRLQSYTATGGPTWLSPLINAEAEPTNAIQ
ncbi:uncharacterized protein LOC130511899 [Raphanus sativus]|uniref:Uncharacterized protein LOC130511899 n=1 Tax=Raphanus sativus TaxID=3726 RepID=A0A9W3DQ87_RAPSA|nr:uncharacterized protein LOC130511899 [Raphanus sativus]